jgi:hypothetical protein
MSNKVFSCQRLSSIILLTIGSSCFLLSGCAVEAAKAGAGEKTVAVETANLPAAVKTSAKTTKGASIEIEQDSPADTVRVFYKNLREKKFREAMFLTNLRPAIEGLTDTELADLQVDFDPIARAIPTEIEINGEIISGKYATVTAKLPDNESKQIQLQEIRLRQEGSYWVILTVDETAEGQIKKEGSKYFFNLRLETHQSEAKAMLERIYKAQMVYALQNDGKYADLKTLVDGGLLPEDAQTADSTGYRYRVVVSSDKKKYYATAEPSVYGKNGKLSYLVELDDKKTPRLTSKDNQGQPLKK